MWFTAQNANVMGRLDPKTGDIKIIKSPTPNSRPYGILMNSKGVPVVVLFGTNKVATIDPGDHGDEGICVAGSGVAPAPPRARRTTTRSGTRTSRAASSAGFDLRTGGASRSGRRRAGRSRNPTASPSPKARSGTTNPIAKPNTIVRFDLQTEKFQSWPIPGGGDIVRNMDVTRRRQPGDRQ